MDKRKLEVTTSHPSYWKHPVNELRSLMSSERDRRKVINLRNVYNLLVKIIGKRDAQAILAVVIMKEVCHG